MCCCVTYVKFLLLQILVYPPSSHVLFSNIFMFIVNKTSNDVIGYSVTDTELTGSPQDITNGYYTTDPPAQLLWRVHIPNDQEIIDVKSHHSVGNTYQHNVLSIASVVVLSLLGVAIATLLPE